MKKFILGTLLIVFSFSNAQVSVNVNVGTPPVWGPAITTQEYYYLPDIDSYYDIRQSKFIYLNNGVWIRAKSLPNRYRSYNLNTGHIIIINDYHGHNPYANYRSNRAKYYKSNNNWQKSQKREVKSDNGKHKGNNKGNGKGRH